jgi:hypothetical protein
MPDEDDLRREQPLRDPIVFGMAAGTFRRW